LAGGGWLSVGSIATQYGLDCQGSNPGGARLSMLVQVGLEAHIVSWTMGIGVFPGGEVARVWC
jgi:hypothetical protein